MLVSGTFLTVLKWLGLLVAAGLGCGLAVTPHSKSGRMLLFIGGIAVALGIAFGLKELARPVLIVKQTEHDVVPLRTRAYLFFSRTYTFQDGRRTSLGGGEGTLVVNDTKRPLSVKTFSYG